MDTNQHTFIVYLDDADSVLRQMPPGRGARGTPLHWVLVACAPRMTRRIGKWVSHSAREQWRQRWADKLFAQVVPALRAGGDNVTPVLAKGPLPALTQQLLARHGAARVLDLRRPKFGQELAPLEAGRAPEHGAGWQVSGAVLGMGALALLAAE
jgi:hypothetical protein